MIDELGAAGLLFLSSRLSLSSKHNTEDLAFSLLMVYAGIAPKGSIENRCLALDWQKNHDTFAMDSCGRERWAKAPRGKHVTLP
jgi:hypothetical protein